MEEHQAPEKCKWEAEKIFLDEGFWLLLKTCHELNLKYVSLS